MKEYMLPLKTGRGLNERECWQVRARRAKRERGTAFACVSEHPLPCVVTLIRVSPGTLDDDAPPAALKAVRDGIADRLRIDDRDPRVQWRYGQEVCKRGEFGVRVRIETIEESA